MADNQRFARLGRPERIWAIPSIHAQVDQLKQLHHCLAGEFQPGDRIVYLGNLTGYGTDPLATIEELMRFRREIIARRNVLHIDIAYLRGAQEEIWHKLLQLQFAPNPSDVLRWMLSQGVEPLIRAYGGDAGLGMNASRTGASALARWTNALRQSMRQMPGHTAFFTSIRRAAFTEYRDRVRTNTLLVSAGVCPSTDLDLQGDTFWFGGLRFPEIREPIHGFGRVVRGRCYRRQQPHPSPEIGPVAACLDGGCGPAGGPLVLAAIMPNGRVSSIRHFEAASGSDAAIPAAIA
jgi:hypothetical protein